MVFFFEKGKQVINQTDKDTGYFHFTFKKCQEPGCFHG